MTPNKTFESSDINLSTADTVKLGGIRRLLSDRQFRLEQRKNVAAAIESQNVELRISLLKAMLECQELERKKAALVAQLAMYQGQL